MYISVFMGPISLGPAQDKPNIDLCLSQAAAAAEAGFAMVTFGEQHFNNYEPYSNPFLMAARLAPELGGTWFGTTIVPLVFHHPLRLAEDASVIDLLTEGRFIMGMSAGRVGFSPDFANFGLDPERRHEIFASKLAILRRAFVHTADQPPLVMDTPWDRGALNGRMMPYSYRAGGPLIAVGTNTDTTISEYAAQGVPVFLGPCLPQDAARKFAAYRDATAAAGHDAETLLGRSLVTRHVIVGATEEKAWERAELMAGRNPMMDRSSDTRSLRELSEVDLSDPAAVRDPANRNAVHVQSWIIAGTPDTVVRQINEYEKAGVPQLLTRFTVGAYNPAEIGASFRLFVDEVMPQINATRFPELRDDEIRPEHRPAPAATMSAESVRNDVAALAGRWNAVIATPMGDQRVVLDLAVDAAQVTGTATQNGATVAIADGSVGADEAQWTVTVTAPFPMTLSYRVQAAGDTLTGSVQAGTFPPSRLTGERAG
ncbi:LLM class flavin-dependent oxidoreductase [Actinoplanes sp. NPDC026619]|uniref:LLM class flavin-dependent oxidoreductase n=1 Tax=Actinoplanes sp. NPDC026619 TaxID=3155798 RepID=UPI0033D6AE4F